MSVLAQDIIHKKGPKVIGLPDSDHLYSEYVRRRRKRSLYNGLLLGFIVAVLIWAWLGTEFTVLYFFSGLGNIASFIVNDLIPPDLSVLPMLLKPALESFYMAYLGAVGGVVLSIVFGFLAARNLSFHPLLATISRMIITFIRAVPGLVIAIFFVGAFGIGPLAGTLAIAIGGIGILAKAYADILEEIDHGQVEAIRATGASWFQVIGQAVWPQFYAGFVTWSLYKMDMNIRESAILGMVGAGGLGTVLMTNISFFQYQQAATVILIIFVMILVVEYASAKLRERIL